MRGTLSIVVALVVAVAPCVHGGTAFAASTAAVSSVAARPSFSQPSISPDGREIAFVANGAIWEVAASGGAAHLLIAAGDDDSRPLFSPNGKYLAFTRGGAVNETPSPAGDVYVLDLATGSVRRLTYADGFDEASGWSPDSRWVYFNSPRDNIFYVGRLNGVYRVRVTGGTPMPVSQEPYRDEEQGVPSPNDQTIALISGGWGETQWWRRGSAHIDDGAIWLLQNNGSHTYRRLTPGDARADWPMWAPDARSLYYMSDRSGAENLWHVQLDGSEVPLTHFTRGLVVWPTIAGNGRTIAFERHFGIWVADTATGETHKVPIHLVGAVAPPSDQHVSKHDGFSGLALSPDGKKIAFIAHGEVYAASARTGGDALQVTHAPQVAYDLAWAPDSRRIVFGAFRGYRAHLYEYDFVSGKKRQLTHGGGEDTTPAFSPDGKQLAFLRNGNELEVLDVASGKVRTLARGRFDFERPLAAPRPLAWSPDGRWVAVLRWGPRMFRNALVVNVASGKAIAASGLGNTFGSDIAFTPDGRRLLFATGQRTHRGEIAAIDLVPRTPHFAVDQFLKLFAPPARPGATGVPGSTRTRAVAPGAPRATRVQVDAQGILNRLTLLPTGLDARAITLSPDGKTLVVTAEVAGHANLYAWPLVSLGAHPPVARQLTSTPGAKTDVQFSPDGKRVYYLDAGKVFSVALDHSGKPQAIPISANVDVDFAADTMLSFEQAWTWLRNDFHNPAMNGVDWNGIRAKYAPRIAGAEAPASVDWLMNRLVGELDSSHSGVYPAPSAKPTTGRLGLEFQAQVYATSGKLEVATVVPLSPAAIAGIRPGDVLLAVDGHPLGAGVDLYALLAHRIGRKTVLRIAVQGRGRDVDVKPVDSHTRAVLAYNAWVRANRRYVDRLSDGKLGYVDLIDMEPDALQRFYRELDAYNLTRAGVVVDVRDNFGGFVNAYVLDALARHPYLNMTPRGLDQAVPARSVLGQYALERPTDLVVNRMTLSDGEDFTEGYEELHLGQVVGEPTAGWIIFTANEKLLDGQVVRIPFSTITTASGQPMELHPRPVNVPVTRELGMSYRGQDPDLEAAVRTLLQQLDQPHRVPGSTAGK